MLAPSAWLARAAPHTSPLTVFTSSGWAVRWEPPALSCQSLGLPYHGEHEVGGGVFAVACQAFGPPYPRGLLGVQAGTQPGILGCHRSIMPAFLCPCSLIPTTYTAGTVPSSTFCPSSITLSLCLPLPLPAHLPPFLHSCLPSFLRFWLISPFSRISVCLVKWALDTSSLGKALAERACVEGREEGQLSIL